LVVPFVAYVHAREPDEPEDQGRSPWEPNWRVWRWVGAAVVVAYGATHSSGVIASLLVLGIFALCCRAAIEVFPDGGGLRDWRQ
jgi:hypothetical protein